MAKYYEDWKYDSRQTSVANGASDTPIPFQNIATCIYFMITNDSNSGSISIKLNGVTGFSIIVGPRETFKLNDFRISSVHVSNASGADITYRIVMGGF